MTLTQTEAAPRFFEWPSESSTGPLHSSPAGAIRWSSGWVPNAEVQNLSLPWPWLVKYRLLHSLSRGQMHPNMVTGMKSEPLGINKIQHNQQHGWLLISDFQHARPFCPGGHKNGVLSTPLSSKNLCSSVHLTSFIINHFPKHACFQCSAWRCMV